MNRPSRYLLPIKFNDGVNLLTATASDLTPALRAKFSDGESHSVRGPLTRAPQFCVSLRGVVGLQVKRHPSREAPVTAVGGGSLPPVGLSSRNRQSTESTRVVGKKAVSGFKLDAI
jgi:hypothetical protein